MTPNRSETTSTTQLLAGDVGGTKTLLCIADGVRIVRQQRFENAAYRNFSEVLRAFLGTVPATTLHAACIAVAGPVRQARNGQHVKVTNLPWEVDSAALTQEFGIARVRLINDFAAIGYAVETVVEGELTTLNRGEPETHGPRAIIGAGTGLGQAILVWQQDRYEVVPTEGSKTDFGPTDELQLELARYLMRRHGRASYELILSGSGLVRLHEFVCERAGAAVPSAPTQEDAAAAIAVAAIERNDAMANATLDLFVAIYGAQAGNLALTAGATGGVYIAGGIAPKIISRLNGNAFMRAFTNKGKMSDYVSAIPVKVLMNPEIGLQGAVTVASRLS